VFAKVGKGQLSWSPMRLKICTGDQSLTTGRQRAINYMYAISRHDNHTNNSLICSQIDQNKIQSRLPIGHFLFTFPLL